MSSEIIIAILSLIGTAIGSLAGVITSNKLTVYRIEQLEKKVDKHNNLIDRMYQCEEEIKIINERIKGADK